MFWSIVTPILQQQANPIGFLEALNQSNQKIWWSAWLLRGSISVAVALILGLVALLNGQDENYILFYAILVPLFLQICSGIAVIPLGYAQFWLLYAYSPPALSIALLAGMIPVWPDRLIPWVGISLTYFVAIFISDACTIWVYKQQVEIERNQERMRKGGVASDLPTLALYQQARQARLAFSIVGATLVGWLFNGTGLILLTVLALIAILGGCLRLDATILSWLPNFSLVEFDPQKQQWQTTYIGRSALFISPKQIEQVIISASSPSNSAQIVVTLLKQGYLGPFVRRAVKNFSFEQGEQLLLHLSLQAGGATAIHYLIPALPTSLLPIARCYAALATEAAKPFNLQQWLTVLANQPLSTTKPLIIYHETTLQQILNSTKNSLLTYTHSTVVEDVFIQLQSFIMAIYGFSNLPNVEIYHTSYLKTLPLTWPVTLFFHLNQHRQRLHAT